MTWRTPPTPLSREEQAAWDAAVRSVDANDIELIDVDAFGLHMMVTLYVRYRQLLNDARQQPEKASALVREAEEWRVELRNWATNHLLIPESRTHLAAMREDGVDLELARIFEPPVDANP